MGYVGGDSNVVGMWMRFLRFEAQRNEAGMRHNFTRGPIRASAEAGPRHLGIGTYSIDRLLSLRKIIQVFVRESLYSWRSLQRCSTWFCSHLSESPTSTTRPSTTRRHYYSSFGLGPTSQNPHSHVDDIGMLKADLKSGLILPTYSRKYPSRRYSNEVSADTFVSHSSTVTCSAFIASKSNIYIPRTPFQYHHLRTKSLLWAVSLPTVSSTRSSNCPYPILIAEHLAAHLASSVVDIVALAWCRKEAAAAVALLQRSTLRLQCYCGMMYQS